MNIIVCGSRSFNDYIVLKETLDWAFQNIKNDVTIVSGCAKGADTLAIRYAKENNLPYTPMPADWHTYGTSAGFIRNLEMLDIANGVVAFVVNNSKGTMHTVTEAKKRNLKTIVKHFSFKGVTS